MTDRLGIPSGAVHGEQGAASVPGTTAAQYLEGWKRARADYENLHRRQSEVQQRARNEGTRDAFLSFIHILDYFDAALTSLPADLAAHPWAEGVRNIEKACAEALKTEGIAVITERNVPFDPTRHEAVAHVPGDAPAGTVTEVLSKGYERLGSVLRPAKVAVSAGPSADGGSKAPAAVSTHQGVRHPAADSFDSPSTKKGGRA
jgi:molecular chaperone GrpE